MRGGVRVDVAAPGGGGDGGGIRGPENMRGREETLAIAGDVMGFAQQMSEGKADVEGRIAEMNHLVVEQDQFALVDENIFGAVVAVDQAEAAGVSGLDDLVKRAGRLRELLGGVAVVGLDAQRFEEGAVFKKRVQVRPRGRFEMDRADEAAELIEMVLDDVVGEKKRFEVVVRIGNGGHGEEILLAIIKNERRDGAGRSQLGKILQRERFAMDAGRIGKPN